jgi:RHS repeat-associated protein
MEKVGEEVTFFVWDGDTLLQEVKPDNTVTYLYEPDSFVPLAQVHSNTPYSLYESTEVAKKQDEKDILEAEKEQEAENLKWLKVTDAAAYEQAVKTIAQRDEKEQQQAFKRLEEQAQSDRIYFINTDHLGTPQEVVSEDGKVVWLARYRAWGRVHKLDKAEVRQPLRFQGQYEDAETGLYYNRHRYYDSDTGRFITQDPIGLIGGENLYQYGPNPIGWIDPLGLAKTNCPKISSCEPCESATDVGWTSHGNKHVAPKNTPWKEVVSSTKTGAAKYKPGTNIEMTERSVWATETPVSTGGKNTTWKVAALPGIIGASEGKETNLVRVECSQGIIHGHPISQREYAKLTKR